MTTIKQIHDHSDILKSHRKDVDARQLCNWIRQHLEITPIRFAYSTHKRTNRYDFPIMPDTHEDSEETLF